MSYSTSPSRSFNTQKAAPKHAINPSILPPQPPAGKPSPFYAFLSSLDRAATASKRLVVYGNFTPPCFDEASLRIDNHFDQTTAPFFTGRVRNYNKLSGYGFLVPVSAMTQAEFFFHASGFEQPEITVAPPSESLPYAIFQVGGRKLPRGAKLSTMRARPGQSDQFGKPQRRELQHHTLTELPQRDAAIAFSCWDDPAKKNKVAGRWMPQWMYDRISVVVAIIVAKVPSLLKSYRVLLCNGSYLPNGTDCQQFTELFRTNYPMQAAAGYARVRQMLATDQTILLQECDTHNVVEPEEIKWATTHPLTRLSVELNHYLSHREAACPE